METVLFRKGEIEITESIARFGTSSYPIANIGAVSVEDSPSSLLGCGGMLAIGAIVLLIAGRIGGAALSAIVGVGLMWAGSSMGQTKLMLRTSSGNEQAFQSKDKVLVGEVKTAIEAAVSSRR